LICECCNFYSWEEEEETKSREERAADMIDITWRWHAVLNSLVPSLGWRENIY
jgi:hypothetical protein